MQLFRHQEDINGESKPSTFPTQKFLNVKILVVVTAKSLRVCMFAWLCVCVCVRDCLFFLFFYLFIFFVYCVFYLSVNKV